MDGIFSRYSDPMGAMDLMIGCGRFADFVKESTERLLDEKLFQTWLHKVFDGRSFARYKADVYRPAQPRMSDKRVADIVSDSLDILEGFNPE